MAASSSSSSSLAVVVVAAAVALVAGGGAAVAQLCEEYYDCTCPDAGATRRLLLDSVPGMPSEKTSPPNNNSARGFPVVDDVKAALEDACPGVVSCADILALAAEISVELSGGPGWGVLLGRLDGKTSDFNGSLNLPAPTDNLTVLRQKFAALNLNDVDLVALSGGHTFGRVQCQFVTDRLYNFSNTGRPDPTMDAAYRSFLSQRCPPNGPPAALNDLDPTTPDTFDNHYYTNIEVNRGFLQSDQELKSGPEAKGTKGPIVARFATSQAAFLPQLRAVHDQHGQPLPCH
ncbi:hypothetical protein OsJ_30494 [Oryza sativa Japonica Group]|uniref:Peroxidase n=1 Tax=Oryza sativa subsp. japonica TaxID=39947 RepID=A3C1W9_ORYSJ|nr:hypothetical protein OsJ_30494 [Oryza sativa Japonica Group]